MKPRQLLFALAAVLSFLPARTSARNIDSDSNAWLVRNGRLFRIDYANDLFAGRDRYYTQGYGFDFFHPALGGSPLTRLMLSLPGEDKVYGLTFRHCGFTPSRLDSDAALRGDRPFAGYLFLGQTVISQDPGSGLTLTSELDAGLIGQGAGGKQIQTGLHGALGNFLPQGWDNQIRNDLVLDYTVRLEKQVAASGWADAAVFADGTLGTLYTNASAGLAVRLGEISRSDKRLYFFGRAEEKAVGYDATLQGGVFNRDTPYTLSPDEIERVVPDGEAGVVLQREGFALQFTRSFLGREFKGGMTHQWGEISFIKYF